VAASGENIAGKVQFEKQQALKAVTQDLEKLKLLSKHTVDQLPLELTGRSRESEAGSAKRGIQQYGSE
jgi:hypothetical protein